MRKFFKISFFVLCLSVLLSAKNVYVPVLVQEPPQVSAQVSA